MDPVGATAELESGAVTGSFMATPRGGAVW